MVITYSWRLVAALTCPVHLQRSHACAQDQGKKRDMGGKIAPLQMPTVAAKPAPAPAPPEADSDADSEDEFLAQVSNSNFVIMLVLSDLFCCLMVLEN